MWQATLNCLTELSLKRYRKSSFSFLSFTPGQRKKIVFGCIHSPAILSHYSNLHIQSFKTKWLNRDDFTNCGGVDYGWFMPFRKTVRDLWIECQVDAGLIPIYYYFSGFSVCLSADCISWGERFWQHSSWTLSMVLRTRGLSKTNSTWQSCQFAFEQCYFKTSFFFFRFSSNFDKSVSLIPWTSPLKTLNN